MTTNDQLTATILQTIITKHIAEFDAKIIMRYIVDEMDIKVHIQDVSNELYRLNAIGCLKFIGTSNGYTCYQLNW